RQFGLSARAIPMGTIAGVFDEVQRGLADYGVVPVENSTEGVVNHTLDTFLVSDLRISAEILLGVDHCLLVRAGLELGEGERVYSRRRGRARCGRWLSATLPRATTIEAASTAEAARLARDDARGAAVASELAGKLYDLTVARRGIADVAQNLTRFLVIGTRQAEPTGKDRTSILIALADQTGSLCRVPWPLA